MALNLPLDRALRTPAELAALVAAVASAGEEDETDWMEWKSTLDLLTSAGAASAARAVLGLANRDPSPAVEGCGYLVVGAEPGRVEGVARVDPAQLTDRLRPFLGEDGPRWSAQYVDHDGVAVLVVTVEAARPGDRIFSLRKQHERMEQGVVFVRRPGQTDRARQPDLDRLAARATGRPPLGGITVTATGALLQAVDLDVTADAEEFADARAAELLAPLGSADPALPFERLRRGVFIDSRGPDAFRDAVEQWRHGFVAAAPAAVRSAAARSGAGRLVLTVEETLGRNVSGLEVVMVVPAGVEVELPADADATALPDPPRPWGTVKHADHLGVVASRVTPGWHAESYDPGPWVEPDGRGCHRITFDSFHLRPLSREGLDPVHVLAPPALVGTALTLRWEATGDAIDGRLTGTVDIKVGEDAIDGRAVLHALIDDEDER